ncbi:EpsG family protein [Deminuibacter soli]|uniref:EpsG family protein n=1 Tax=Deminuibacter soli TaxID=2291815 RepID=UPI001314EDC0|nr:EpsG family protein [Deminuibacter soli]
MTKAIANISEKQTLLLLSASIILVWFIAPVLSIFAILGYLIVTGNQKQQFFILLVSLSFGLIAYTGQSIGPDPTDISRYHNGYNLLSDTNSFSSFLVLFVVDGGGNPIFYLVNFVLSRIFPHNPQILVLVWVTITYYFTTLSVIKAMEYLKIDIASWMYIGIIGIVVLGIIPFFTVTEIIKQCSSIAIFTYALMKKLLKEKRAFLYLVISLLVHSSSLMVAWIYFVYEKKNIAKWMLVILMTSVLLAFFNLNVILSVVLSPIVGDAALSRVKEYENVEVWSISFRHYSCFAVFLLSILPSYYYYKKAPTTDENAPAIRNMLNILCLVLCVLLINHGNVHNFVRYIYGLFPFYILAVILLLSTKIARDQKYFLVLLISAFFTYSNFKLLSVQTSEDVNYANSYFNNSLLNMVTSNVIDFLSFTIRQE